MYHVFTRMPGGVTVVDSCICCRVPCLSSVIISLFVDFAFAISVTLQTAIGSYRLQLIGIQPTSVQFASTAKTKKQKQNSYEVTENQKTHLKYQQGLVQINGNPYFGRKERQQCLAKKRELEFLERSRNAPECTRTVNLQLEIFQMRFFNVSSRFSFEKKSTRKSCQQFRR